MKSNTKKRLIAFMLCMVLVLSSAISAFADDLDTQAQDQTTTMADEPVATSMDDSTDEQQPVAEAEENQEQAVETQEEQQTEENVSEEWLKLRQELMSLLQDEAQLEEIVKMVGMDALSAPDRLKMEATRSIREDFLHQNSFHEIDTYTSLNKQYLMMKLVLGYYYEANEALSNGASIDKLIALPIREQIGRFKYTKEEDIQSRYDEILKELEIQVAGAFDKEDF